MFGRKIHCHLEENYSLSLYLYLTIIHCLKTILFIYKFANHRTKEFFVSTANNPLVETLMTIGGVTVSIAIKNFVVQIHYPGTY